MQNRINQQLAHTYIIKELAFRTLEYDKQHLKQLKSQAVILTLFETTLNRINKELVELRKEMGQEGLKQHEGHKIDELFTAYTFSQKGITEELRYSNHALKNQTMDELERLFNLRT